MTKAEPITLDQYFSHRDEGSRVLFEAVRAAFESIGPITLRITKSQIAFRRRLGFAWTWMPGQYLSGDVAALVLTLALHRRDQSSRWKQVVELRPGRFIHHLEIRSVAEIDSEVLSWVREAWEQAE